MKVEHTGYSATRGAKYFLVDGEPMTYYVKGGLIVCRCSSCKVASIANCDRVRWLRKHLEVIEKNGR